MNLANLEQIVGPIKRGQLAEGFHPDFSLPSSRVEEFLSDDRCKAKPPPLTEDLSHLNHSKTAEYSKRVKDYWKRLTPKQKQERKKQLAAAGKIGGVAAKVMRHLSW
jgi:hypothetical protein